MGSSFGASLALMAGAAAPAAAARLVGGAAHARLGHEQARRRRHDQRRHLGHEAVAAGEERVGLRRVGEAQALLGDPNDDAADDIDEVMRSAAMASPRTNFEAPSMAP